MSSSPSSSGVAELTAGQLPTHVAIIMDGNGRWAKKHLLNRIKGHEKGAETVRTIVRTCREIGIPILTLYAFSTENWERPKREVTALMNLLKKFLESEAEEMLRNDIRLNAIGQVERLPQSVRQTLNDVMARTCNNDRMLLNLALSYGGRAEIVKMVQEIAAKVQTAGLDPAGITAKDVTDHLYTRGMADPDLLIRTSGEFRISNFLLWQIAYAEIFVTNTLWPDFNREEFIGILKNYQERERRFGRVGAS